MKKIIILGLIVTLGSLSLIYHFGFVKSKSTKADLTIIGRIKMADGIGRQSIEVIKALQDDVSINFKRTELLDLTDVPKKVQDVLQKRGKDVKLAPVILFEEVLWYPGVNHYKHIFGISDDHIKIAYSMYESSRISQTWVSILNTYFDAAAVPDEYLVDVYKNSGVTIPVFHVPLTIDLSPVLAQNLKQQKNTPFVFANFSTCDHRKNHEMLVKAFTKAFGNRSDVQLRMSYRWGNPKLVEKLQKEVEELGLSNIQFFNIEHDTPHYIKNFKGIDCYVSLSKGEGFSIQPREAMALGIPVIATDNTAQSTICKSGLVRTVPSNIAEPAYFNDGERVGDFYNCSIEDAAEAMLDVYNNYNKYLENGPDARKWAAQYNTSSLHDIYLNLVKPKKVVLGKENRVTSEYLETTSKELYEKYVKVMKKSSS